MEQTIQGEEKHEEEVAEKADRHVRKRVRKAEIQISRDAKDLPITVVDHGFGDAREDQGVIVRAAEVKGFDGVQQGVLLHVHEEDGGGACLEKLPKKRDGKTEKNAREDIRPSAFCITAREYAQADKISNIGKKDAGKQMQGGVPIGKSEIKIEGASEKRAKAKEKEKRIAGRRNTDAQKMLG